MFKGLKGAGVEAELLTVKGGRHNVSGAGRPEFFGPAIPFIKKHLKVE